MTKSSNPRLIDKKENRKAKRDKQTKLEEEAAAKATEAGTTAEKIETDLDILDALVYMPDYPTT